MAHRGQCSAKSYLCQAWQTPALSHQISSGKTSWSRTDSGCDWSAASYRRLSHPSSSGKRRGENMVTWLHMSPHFYNTRTAHTVINGFKVILFKKMQPLKLKGFNKVWSWREAHRQLESQLKLLVLEKLVDLAGYGQGNKAPNKVVAGNVDNVWPLEDKMQKRERECFEKGVLILMKKQINDPGWYSTETSREVNWVHQF